MQFDTSSIPVYVAPTYQLPGQQQQAVVHEVVGYIQVPMQASAQQVYDTLQVGSWQRRVDSTSTPSSQLHAAGRSVCF